MRSVLAALLLLLAGTAVAQKAVVLQHEGTTTIFSSTNPLGDAYAAAVSGDTIYLPGGIFPGLGITKRLTIFGAGHYPDSTATTGVTQVASIDFQSGSDGSTIQGLLVPGAINFSYNIKIDSVIVSRCYAGGITFHGENTPTFNCVGILLFQNVVGDMILRQTDGVRVFNNIISAVHETGTNTWIRNNKINGLYNAYYALLENNSIASYSSGIDYNTFRNNILAVQPAVGNNTWAGNYYNVDFGNLFVQQTTWFAYTDNYHLKTPASYLGTDATVVGIYGGFYPYKEGAVPAVPHIQAATIPLQADANGLLNIQLKVAAQNN